MFHKEDTVRYRRLLGYILPYWKAIAAAAAATLVYGATEPLMPWVMKNLIDHGFGDLDDGTRNMHMVYLFIAAMIGGFILRGLSNYISSYATTWLGQQIIFNLRAEMFAKVLRLPMRYYDRTTIGAILSKFNYDLGMLMEVTTGTIISFIRDSITILALVGYLFYLDWRMTLILMLATPAIGWFIVYISRHLRQLAQSMQRDMGGINHVLDEALRGRAIVRIYNGYRHEIERFNRQALTVQKHILSSQRISSIISPVLEVIIVIALSAVIIIAAHQSAEDGMTTGKFVAFLGSMALLFPPIKRLGRLNEPVQRGLAGMESIFAFLDEPEEENGSFSEAAVTQGAIRFENISFQYDEQPVLENFSLDIKAGETVALVGESGSGKSTIAALLAGFYAPDAGAIYIDGINTAGMSLADRRQGIAYVSQDTILFTGTAAENIAYADAAPDRGRLIQAAQMANAADFLSALENGYDTDIGQQGGRLSGGQKQRVAIARALYKDAPILILDEATSALDNRSEKKVQEAIERLRQNRTAIIIAHRLSTIENADRIVVLDRGRIVESGSHAELLAKSGYYAHLVNKIPKEEDTP